MYDISLKKTILMSLKSIKKTLKKQKFNLKKKEATFDDGFFNL
jgi:hypothetical protein